MYVSGILSHEVLKTNAAGADRHQPSQEQCEIITQIKGKKEKHNLIMIYCYAYLEISENKHLSNSISKVKYLRARIRLVKYAYMKIYSSKGKMLRK